jgi:hypothetical protein
MYTRTNTQPFAYTLPDGKQTVKRRKTNWIDHILHRNCLLKHISEGKIQGRIEVMGREQESKSYWITLTQRENETLRCRTFRTCF